MIEFGEEILQDEDDIRKTLEKKLNIISSEVTAHLQDERAFRVLEGIQIALLGAPNIGKSSLINALCKQDISIVHNQAGTTRDVVQASTHLAGLSVVLCDMAGIRQEAKKVEVVEREGIRRAKNKARSASMRLWIVSGKRADEIGDLEKLAGMSVMPHDFIIINKTDLYKAKTYKEKNIYALSLKTKEGFLPFLDALTTHLLKQFGSAPPNAFTRMRHKQALLELKTSLGDALETKKPPELLAENMRLSLRALGQLLGQVGIEDLLDVVFQDFCIGK